MRRRLILLLAIAVVVAACGGGEETLYRYEADPLCAEVPSSELVLVSDSAFDFEDGEYAITQNRTSADTGIAVATGLDVLSVGFGPGYPIYGGGRIVSWNPIGAALLDSATGIWWEPGYWDMSGSDEYSSRLGGFKAEGEYSRACPDAPGSTGIEVRVRDEDSSFVLAGLVWTLDFAGGEQGTGVEFDIGDDGLISFGLFSPGEGATIEGEDGSVWRVVERSVDGDDREVLILDRAAPDGDHS